MSGFTLFFFFHFQLGLKNLLDSHLPGAMRHQVYCGFPGEIQIKIPKQNEALGAPHTEIRMFAAQSGGSLDVGGQLQGMGKQPWGKWGPVHPGDFNGIFVGASRPRK